MYLKNEYNEKDGGIMFSIFVVAIILTSFLIQIVIQIVASLSGVKPESISDTAAATWIIQGSLYAVLLGVVVFYHRKQKINFIKAAGLDKKFTPVDITMSVVLGIGMLFAFLLITFLYSYFLQEIGYKSDGGFFEINNFGIFLLAILIMCVLPAVVEETVFRGAVLKGYSKVFSTAGAVLLSALFFMLMHMNLSQVVYPILSGVIMAVLVHKTKTVKVSMIAHFISNFVLVLITYAENFAVQDEPISETIILNWETVTAYLIYFVIGIVLLSVAFYYFFKSKDDNSTAVQKSEFGVEKNESVFGTDDNQITTVQDNSVKTVLDEKNRKKWALLYALPGILAAVGLVILSLFL